jgi:FkbM family methyltransferase
MDQLIAAAARAIPMMRGRWRLHSLVSAVTPKTGMRQARIHGANMSLDLSSDIEREIYLGVYDYEETATLRRRLRPGSIFVDVGANLGYYTAVASQLVGAAGRVISFEPSPVMARRLRTTFSEHPNVALREVAVGAAPAELTLWENTEGRFDPSFYQYESSMRPVAVQVDTLDRQLADVQRINLLKMDIEGHEVEALRGAQAVLRRTSAVLCEFNERLLSMAGSSVAQLYKAFLDAGFADEHERSVPSNFETRLLVKQ